MIRIENGRLVISPPVFIYDFIQWIFFPINYLLGILCYLQPQKSIWNEPEYETQDISGTGINLDELKQIVLTKKSHVYNEADVVRLFDSLPVASAEKDLINRVWEGKILRTNRSALDFAYWAINWPLKLLGFQWGKRYCTANKGDPLFLRWLNLVYLPLPMWGNVAMIDIKWRGKTTATMNYDHQPWRDYFRVLSNEDGQVVMLGVWTHKHIAGGWFTLTLDEAITATGKSSK
jgi:hypothetical protein